jgi:cell division protein FtsN
MISRIKSETSLKKIRLIELSKTNYRVLLGPFNDINSLKESFEKLSTLYFENLEIIKNV